MTTKKKNLLKLRHLCSAGLPALTIMPLLSKQIHQLIPCLSFTFIYVDDDCRPLEYYAEHFNEQSHQLFCQKGAELVTTTNDPASFKLLFALPAVYGNLIHPPTVFYESANYQHFFKPNGIYHVMDMQLTDNGKPIAMGAIFREKLSQSAYTKQEQTLLPLIREYLQHLALAPNTFNKPCDSMAHKPIELTDATEQSSCSIIVNNQGKLLMASAQAIALLKTAVTAGQRHALDKQDMSDLLQTLCNTSQKNTTQLPIMRLATPGGILVLRAYRLENLTAGSDIQQENMIAIHIAKQVPTAYKIWQNLMRFKLTVQEQRVAWLLCQGYDATRVAQQLSIKYSTYRTYVKNLLAQCRVNSTTELVNILKTS